MESFKKQAKEQGFDFRVWEGFIDRAAIFRGINLSHKKVIQWAKDTKQDRIFIAEDDVVFVGGNKAWEYYLSQMPEKFSMYLSMVYEGEIDENNKLVKGGKTFSGMTLYCVHHSFYEEFLKTKLMGHIDKLLGEVVNKYDFYVCNPMVCKQSDGYSDQKKKDCKYDHLLKGRKMFEG